MTTRVSVNSSIKFVLITIFIDTIGIGILIPIIPELIQQLAELSISDAAIYGGFITALFALMQLFFSPVLGSLSDAFGRRPILLLSLLAFGINYILMGLATSLTWLFVAQALAGVFGATQSVAAAYIADITEPNNRAKLYGAMGAAFGLGFIVGPLLSGVLSTWGIRLPFFIAASLSLLNVIYGFLVLPESLNKENRRAFDISLINPLGVFRHLSAGSALSRLLIAVLLMQLALQTVSVIWPYYTGFKFYWTAREVGWSLGLYGLIAIIVQGVLLGRLSNWLGDVKAACVGLVCMVISLIGFAFVGDVWLLVLFILPSAMGFMTTGAVNAHLSRQCSLNQQGAMQGAIASVNSLAAIITPLLMSWLFSVFSKGSVGLVFPGMPFLVAAMFAGCSLFIIGKQEG